MVPHPDSILYGGYQLLLNDPAMARRDLEMHVTDETGFDFFRHVQSAIELRPCAGGMYELREWCADGASDAHELVRLPEGEWEKHAVFALEAHPQGSHRLGGERPAGLVLPRHEVMKTCFHYIGYIDGSDPRFAWTGLHRLHIVWPLYECVHSGIYLDLARPDAPEVLNPDAFDAAWYNSDMSEVDALAFEETPCQTAALGDVEAYGLGDYPPAHLGLCGIPLWLQSADVPVCPRTGETMRFVCGIGSDKIPAMPGREATSLGVTATHMSFGDGGTLYVFYHPGSKVMFLQAQW